MIHNSIFLGACLMLVSVSAYTQESVLDQNLVPNSQFLSYFDTAIGTPACVQSSGFDKEKLQWTPIGWGQTIYYKHQHGVGISDSRLGLRKWKNRSVQGYIECQLTCPLMKDSTYVVTYSVSALYYKGSPYPSQFGWFLSDTVSDYEKNRVFDKEASFVTHKPDYLAREALVLDSNWISVRDTFVAKGNEITLGFTYYTPKKRQNTFFKKYVDLVWLDNVYVYPVGFKQYCDQTTFDR